jgi:signal transduction histidine kinase
MRLLGQGSNLNAAVFGPDNQMIAESGRAKLPPLDSSQISLLAQHGSVMLSPHSVAVARVDHGRLGAYAIVSIHGHPPQLSHATMVYIFVLVALEFQRQHPGRRMLRQFDADCTIMADRVMLARAIGNILDNAQKYSSAAAPIEVIGTVEQSHVMIVVKDQGIGISAEDLPKVFTPFFRADQSRTRGTGGVGLGLALVKRFIEGHGGSIAIESKLGQGTQVTLRLPSHVDRHYGP